VAEHRIVDVREAIEMVVPLRSANHLSHVPISIPPLAIEMLPREECVQAVHDRLAADREGTLATIRMLIANHHSAHISVEDDWRHESGHAAATLSSDELVSA